MKAIDHYFWDLDSALAQTSPFRRNQVIGAVRQCVYEADQMCIAGKPVVELEQTEIDELFGSVDYICYIAESNFQELQRWGKILTSINAYIPEQKQGYWLAIAAIYYMDAKIPDVARQAAPEGKIWEGKNITYTGEWKTDLITRYVPLTLATLSVAGLLMPFIAIIPGLPALIWGLWMLVTDKQPEWLATTAIAAGSLASFVSVLILLSLVL
ncbi:MAG: hypothetical protein Q4P66_07125 [Actinomycetaceae bacterium]|nr:hypothetical protein [Actinomycetaceae bacterium]